MNKVGRKVDEAEKERRLNTWIREAVTHGDGDEASIRKSHKGKRQISVSTRPSDASPHIPVTITKRDTTEKRHTHHHHHREEASSKPSSLNPHTQDTQPKRRPEIKPNRPPFQNDGPTSPQPPNPSTLAQTAYNHSFPNGHLTIPTPTSNLHCGLAATTLTMLAMHPPPHPTTASLLSVFHSPLYASHAAGFGLSNENNFHVDQIGLVLFLWGRERGLDLQVGFVDEGGVPRLVPQPEGRGRVVVWIFHKEGVEGGVGHFEGMRPRGVGRVGEGEGGRVRELGRGVQRRGWVKRLDGRLSAMAESLFGVLDGSSGSDSDSSG